MRQIATGYRNTQPPGHRRAKTLMKFISSEDILIAKLWRALELLVEDHGGEICVNITDSWGNVIPCVIAVRTYDFPAGIGITDYGRDGSLSITYDAGKNDSEIPRKLADEIAIHYNATAHNTPRDQLNRRAQSLQSVAPRRRCGYSHSFQASDPAKATSDDLMATS